jgi:NADH dehydrogenase [ubiquinone] 1 alpha subcomplex assembly factor 5
VQSSIIFDRPALIAHRERAARTAAPPDFLLTHVADDIADRLSLIRRTFARALNLTAATGALSRRLRAMPGVEEVVSSELSPLLARGLPAPALVADEEALPFAPQSFDLVVSGLALQFVNDLPGALAQIRRILKPDGLFMGAMIGGHSLTELRQASLAAESELYGGASPRVAPFVDVRDLGALLQRAGFALPVTDSDPLTVTYADPLRLMQELKAMGASNILVDRRRLPMTRSFLLRIAEIYAERFSDADGRATATFEILTMTAWAPDASQQKPLRPGSAAVRLADALGATELKAGEDSQAPRKRD